MFFDIEVKFIKPILSMNGFPIKLTDSVIHRWLTKRVSDAAVSVTTVPKRKVYLSLTYTGYHCLQLRKKISKWMSHYYPQVDLIIVFKSNHAIGSYFRVKERLPKSLCSSVVYSYKCGICSASYYGKTNRHLNVRASEHLGISFRTLKRVQPRNTAVSEHLLNTDHTGGFDDFRVIARANSDWHLLIKESLLIARDRPTLNAQISSLPLVLF